MFVCICNQVTDKQICSAVNEGASSIDDLSNMLNLGTCCGKCKSCAKKVLREAIKENACAQTVAVGFSPALASA
jgi:bacterioferritin-associated ferredoxin